MQEQLNEWIGEVAQYGAKFNAGKNVHTVMTRIKRREEARMVLCSEEMKKVDSFKYLGVIQKDGRFVGEVNERGRHEGAFLN